MTRYTSTNRVSPGADPGQHIHTHENFVTQEARQRLPFPGCVDNGDAGGRGVDDRKRLQPLPTCLLVFSRRPKPTSQRPRSNESITDYALEQVYLKVLAQGDTVRWPPCLCMRTAAGVHEDKVKASLYLGSVNSAAGQGSCSSCFPSKVRAL